MHNTYFSFQNEFYEQVEGAAMGSLVSLIVANLYMEHFERKALHFASIPPRYWFRFVDDTWVIQQCIHKQEFLEHINSIDAAIKFAVEGTQGNGGIPLLATLVTPEADNSLSFTMYCKPTHTDWYLQWDSYHNLSAKYSVIGTLTHRAKTVCTKPELLQKELSHLGEALVKYKFPPWALNRVQNKLINNNHRDNNDNNIQAGNNNSNTAAAQTPLETIQCRTKAWTQMLPQQTGPQKTLIKTLQVQETPQVQYLELT